MRYYLDDPTHLTTLLYFYFLHFVDINYILNAINILHLHPRLSSLILISIG